MKTFPGWLGRGSSSHSEYTWSGPQTYELPESGLNTYRGGGYVVDLGTSQSSANNALDRLTAFRWLDQHTRALFLELLLYTPNTNLFSSVKILVEYPISSGFYFSKFTVSFKPYPYVDNWDFLIFLTQIIWMALNIYFLVKIIIGIVKQRTAYVKCIWNFLHIVEVTLAFIAVAVYISRTIYVIQVVEKIMNEKGRKLRLFFRVQIQF